MADFLGLMKQAAELKSKMEAMQAELDSSRWRAPRAAARQRQALRKGRDEGRQDRRHADEASRRRSWRTSSSPPMRDARRKVEALLQDKMKTVAGGLPLPPGLKLF